MYFLGVFCFFENILAFGFINIFIILNFYDMSENLLSKKDARVQFERLGISVKEDDVQVGRFFLVEDVAGAKVAVSPFCVCGEGVTGVGVCFVYYYHGILTENRWRNFVYDSMNFLIPERKKKTYAIYARAFSGKHSRFPEFVPKENSEIVRYDLHGHSFKACADEWTVVDGKIVSAKSIFKKPIFMQG